MSIQTELDRIIGLVHESHEKAKAKGGATATPLLANLPGVIESIPQGVELPALTNPGSASDLLSGKQLINADGNVVTGNIATKTASNLSASGATVTVPAGYYASQATKSVATATQATPSISVNSSGLITASATQSAGYVAAGTKTGTKQLTTQAAQTITPGTSDKTIASGRYLTGTQTIKGDSNLVAGNIKSGVSIFGVAGSYEGSGGGGGSTETCTLTLKYNSPVSYFNARYYTSDGQCLEATLSFVGMAKAATIVVPKGLTVINTLELMISGSSSSGIHHLGTIGLYKVFNVEESGTIEFDG